MTLKSWRKYTVQMVVLSFLYVLVVTLPAHATALYLKNITHSML